MTLESGCTAVQGAASSCTKELPAAVQLPGLSWIWPLLLLQLLGSPGTRWSEKSEKVMGPPGTQLSRAAEEKKSTLLQMPGQRGMGREVLLEQAASEKKMMEAEPVGVAGGKKEEVEEVTRRRNSRRREEQLSCIFLSCAPPKAPTTTTTKPTLVS